MKRGMGPNPSNAEATVIQSTGLQVFTKTMLVFIGWIALAEYSQMSTRVPGFQSFLKVFFASFCIGQISNQQHKG